MLQERICYKKQGSQLDKKENTDPLKGVDLPYEASGQTAPGGIIMKRASQQELFNTLPINKAIWQMALPAIISQIIVLIYNMADTFYLGLTNNPYMVAGASLILPVFNISLSISSLCGVGSGTQISRLLGRKEQEQAKKVCSFGIYLSIILTLIFSALVMLFMEPFLLFLGASENTMVFAIHYVFFVIVLGALPTVLSNVLANLCRSIGLSAQAGFGITMGGLLNIVLDPLFMFVLLPKGYEVLGVGIATLISNCIACTYFLVLFFRKRKETILSLALQSLPDRHNIKQVFVIGLPSSIATFLFDLDYIVIDRLMISYSDFALAAIGIVLKVERFPLNVGIGICQGMTPIVAYNFTSGNKERMNRAIAYSLRLGLIISLISLVFYEIFAGGIARIFIEEANTLSYATEFLRIRSLATTLMFCSFFTVYIFQSFGKGLWALFLGVMRWAVFNIPMLYLLNALMGYIGIVWAQFFGDVLTVSLSLGCYLYYIRQSRQQSFLPYLLHPLKEAKAAS